jgi:hypothetical protein
MLQLEQTEATLANINLRTEKMGKRGTRPAADLKFTVNIPAPQLEQIEPGLQASLYRRTDEAGHQADLTAAPDSLTTLRFPKMKPVAFSEDFPGYDARISAGAFDIVDLEVLKGTLKSITIEPQTGGTVKLAFSVGCHPEPEDVAALYRLMGKDVELTLTPPSVQTLQDLRRAQAAKGGPDGEEDEGEDGDDAPPADTAIGRAFPDAVDGRRRAH